MFNLQQFLLDIIIFLFNVNHLHTKRTIYFEQRNCWYRVEFVTLSLTPPAASSSLINFVAFLRLRYTGCYSLAIITPCCCMGPPTSNTLQLCWWRLVSNWVLWTMSLISATYRLFSYKDIKTFALPLTHHGLPSFATSFLTIFPRLSSAGQFSSGFILALTSGSSFISEFFWASVTLLIVNEIWYTFSRRSWDAKNLPHAFSCDLSLPHNPIRGAKCKLCGTISIWTRNKTVDSYIFWILSVTVTKKTLHLHNMSMTEHDGELLFFPKLLYHIKELLIRFVRPRTFIIIIWSLLMTISFRASNKRLWFSCALRLQH